MNWIILITLIITMTYLDIKYSKKLTIIILMFLYLLLGFRDKLGWDYDTYVHFYDNFNYYYKELRYFEESGFVFLISLIKKGGLSSQIQFLIPLMLKVTVIVLILKNNRYRSFGLLLYLALPMFAIRDFSNIRQSLAESIFLYSLYLYTIRNDKKYLFFMLIGPLFHKASILNILYIPFLLIPIKIKSQLQILFTTLVGMIGFLLPSILERDKYFLRSFIGEQYIDYFLDPEIPKLVNFSGTFKGTFISYITIIIFYILITKKKEKVYNKNLKAYYLTFLVGFWMYLLCARLPYPIARLSYFGLQSLIIIFPKILVKQNLKHHKLNYYHLFFWFVVLIFLTELVLKGIVLNTDESLTNKALKFNFTLLSK